MSTSENEKRLKLERSIVRKLIAELRRVGFVPVTVWNGDEYAPQGWRSGLDRCDVPRALTVEAAIDHVFSVDISTLHFAPASDLNGWGRRGVMLVSGNGYDLISDYHAAGGDFEKAINIVSEWIDRKQFTEIYGRRAS